MSEKEFELPLAGEGEGDGGHELEVKAEQNGDENTESAEQTPEEVEAGAEVEAPDHIDVEVVLKLEVTEEVDQDEEGQDDLCKDDDDEDDHGYYIVTEERATNCPSDGNLDLKEDEKREGKKKEVHGKVKRWSKLLKYSMPGRLAEGTESKKKEEDARKKSGESKKGKERRSLKDKMMKGNNDFVNFLSERRAVSESRFKVMDRLGNPNYLVRTKSDQSLEDPWNCAGSVKEIRNKFEDEDIDFSLQIPQVLKDIATKTTAEWAKEDSAVADATDEQQSKGPVEETPKDEDKGYEHTEMKSSGSSSSKINELSHESSNEEGKKVSKGDKENKKGEKKDRKEKKKTCTSCTTSKEHKEHRREKKRAKREKAEKKKSTEELNKVEVDVKETVPENLTARVKGDNFFQKLLIKEQGDIPKMERPSRPRKSKEKQLYVKSSQPSLGKFLKGKQAVSESIFKYYDQVEKHLEYQTLPRGVIADDVSPSRSVLLQTPSGGPLFPRSISNLERYSSRKSSAERAASALSNRSESADKRAYSLPRPTSSLSQRSDSSFMIDQLEYRNYVYEMVHSTPKNARFCKLQEYFNTLDKVVKLEKDASKMEIHKLKSEDIVDFDTWREMRKKEKAQDELDGLLVGLKKAQKERDFHFRPKDVDDVKWSGDSRLRCRDNSVENLKTMFAEKAASGELNLTNSLPKNFI